MSDWRAAANLCGWLSLGCCLPLLMMIVPPGRLAAYPEWMLPVILWGLFLSPFAGTVLALIAATGRRRWLVLALVWSLALAYGWWSLSRHPFDL